MIAPAPPVRLPVPVRSPQRLPAVVGVRPVDADRHRGASDAYRDTHRTGPRPNATRGREVDLVV